MFWRKKKYLENIRQLWGKNINKHRNFDFISLYNCLVANADSAYSVDKKTWNDLNFDSIFSEMDRNITGVGQQILYHILHKYEFDPVKLKKRIVLIEELKINSQLREKIQLALLNVTGFSAYFIAYLVLEKKLPQFKFYKIFYLLSAASLLSLFLIAYNGLFLFISIGILLINLIINRVFSSKIYEYFSGFSGLNNLLSSALAISEIKTDLNINELIFLKTKKKLLESLKSKLGYLVIDKQYLNEWALAMIEYLNMFMLFDIIAYYRSVDTLLKHQEEMHKVFFAVGILDASISIASYLEENKQYCIPEITTESQINFEDIHHPFIQDAIPNTMKDIRNSVLITGSNMSGKTTFIKTLGINFIFLSTLNICFAKSARVPKLIVKTSINRNENLEEGKSYFFAEIEALKSFIDISADGNKYLFLIDEIYRGTNTIERLASSTAVLEYLSKDNFVFVTTHDIELQDLLKYSFNLFHFSEQVENGKFFFNYKIKEGTCLSGNAIKLLEIMSYPKSVIERSNEIVKRLIESKY